MTTNILMQGPVTIPLDFCGMHTGWVSGGGKPTVAVGNMRLLDGPVGWEWRAVETSAGVYSWAALDATVTAWRSQGWTISVPIYGTPAFYTNETGVDQYGHAGASAYPDKDTNLNALKAFISALVTRYNSAGGAWRLANPTLGKGFNTLECWNEPDFAGYNSGAYWTGTASQLVDVCNAIYTTAKAIDPALVVTSPSFYGHRPTVQFLEAYGTLYPKYGAQTFDALNGHPYQGQPYGSKYAGYLNDICYGFSTGFSLIQLAAKYAPGASVYISEYGFDTNTGTKALASLLAEPAVFRYKMLARVMLSAAAMGIKRFGVYRWESTLTGDFTADTNGVVAAYNFVASLVGKTIVAATAEINGPVTLTFSDGSVVSV